MVTTESPEDFAFGLRFRLRGRDLINLVAKWLFEIVAKERDEPG